MEDVNLTLFSLTMFSPDQKLVENKISKAEKAAVKIWDQQTLYFTYLRAANGLNRKVWEGLGGQEAEQNGRF